MHVAVRVRVFVNSGVLFKHQTLPRSAAQQEVNPVLSVDPLSVFSLSATSSFS